MFAYCLNNPVCRNDPSGATSFLEWLEEAWEDASEAWEDVCEAWEEYVVEPIEEAIDYINNEDEQVVLDSEYFAFYKGTLVIRHSSDFLTSGSLFGVIFLNTEDVDETTVHHEYGHALQERELGTMKYMAAVFIPSAAYNLAARENPTLDTNYYDMPWEYDADARGNATRNHSPWAGKLAEIYFAILGG